MARFVNPFPQFIKVSGSPNVGGFLKFFDSGTSSPKDVYSDPEFTQSIGSEVRLDSSGSVPPLFLNGAYAVTQTDPTGGEIDSADPIGVDTDIVNFDLWLNSNTYNIPDIVKGSNDLYYQSTFDGNLGNDPTVSPGFWEQFYFLPTWNATQTYAAGQLAIAIDSRVYQSQVGANIGNDPAVDLGTNWLPLLQSGDVITSTGLAIEKTDLLSAGLKYINDTFLRWELLFDTDESLNLNRHDGAGTLIDTIFSIDVNNGASVFTTNMTLTGILSIAGSLSTTLGNVTHSRNGEAVGMDVNLTSDSLEQNLIAFQDASVDRWLLGQEPDNDFSLLRYDNAGIIQGTAFRFKDGSDDMEMNGRINFLNTDQGFNVISLNGGVFNFDFPLLDTNTENIAVSFFAATNTTGNKFINTYKGDGTLTVVQRSDAADGSIHPAFDRAAEANPGVKLGKITLSTASPVGGQDGDLWLRYTP